MLCLIKPLPDSYAIINHTGYRRCYSHSKCFSTGALVCHLLNNAWIASGGSCYQWRRQRGGRGEAFPLWVDVQKLCNMCALQ